MPEPSSFAESQLAPPVKPPRRRRTFNGRRLMRIGCLPFTLVLTGCLLFFVNLVVVTKAPTWVSNPDEYLLGQRLIGSLGLLMGLQVIGTWLLGLVAAGMAVGASAGQGGMLRQRFMVRRRRAAIAAWAVFVLRLVVLIALAVSTVLAYTYIAEVRSSFRTSRPLYAVEVVVSVLALSMVLLQWLIGPFLRLRYSMALGVWGASWARLRSRRVWMALTARMGAGMCGSLGLLWGSVLGILIIATIRQPFSRSYAIDFDRVFSLFLPGDSWESILFLLGLSVFIFLYMVGQLFLPSVYLWLARRRLAGRPPANVRRRFANLPSEKPENAPAAPG